MPRRTVKEKKSDLTKDFVETCSKIPFDEREDLADEFEKLMKRVKKNSVLAYFLSGCLKSFFSFVAGDK